MKSNYKLMWLVLGFFLILSGVYADNWVCYDETGTATAAELRANFKWQQGSPLQIIRTGSTSYTYTTSSYFTDCGESNTFSYCPENNYYLRSMFNTAQSCVSFGGVHHVQNDVIEGVNCGLGGGPYCRSFVSAGTSSEFAQDFVCGKLNTSWMSMTASNQWVCPTCEELSKRYDTEPIMGNLTSFEDLSFSNTYLYSNQNIDLSFVVYILACLNRVPMLNLRVDLIDVATGEIANTEYGIYAKHETLDYNSENMGMLENYKIPEQSEFRKKYIYNATLSGYRAWAWRQRLVNAMENVVSSLELTVPGFPDGSGIQKFENLYYSSDFLANSEDISDVSLETSQTVSKTQTGSINVLKNMDKIDGVEMCTIYDLRNYISENGLSNNLLSEINGVIPLVEGAEYQNIEVNKIQDEEISFSKYNVEVFSSDVGDLREFANRLERLSLNQQYDLLISEGIITRNEIEQLGRNVVSGWYDYSPNKGCDNYEYKIRDISLGNIDIDLDENSYQFENNTYSNYELTLNLQFNAIWENEIVADLNLDYNIEYSSEYSWNFATLKELNPLTLAKCLYNWDNCVVKEVTSGSNTYKEVADCGLGPPSELAEPTMKDGARGKKSILRNITVYKGCTVGNDWISSEKSYACVDGKYYKCNFGLSADEYLLDVTKAKIGETLKRQNSKGYVCTSPGIWRAIDCLQ